MLLAAAISLIALMLALLFCWLYMICMPGKSFDGAVPPLTGEEAKTRERLEKDLNHLALTIGERNVQQKYDNLVAAARFIEERLKSAGYETTRQAFQARGRTVCNLWADKLGTSPGEGLVIVGAHYDTVPGSPGANDNGSAVVANLELARALKERTLERTVRFVFFANEEYPFFMTPEMGSLVHAEALRKKGEKIRCMLCLETIGCYIDLPCSQRYPPPLNRFYPSTGNFVSFVGNLRSRALVHQAVGAFRGNTAFPSQGIAAPEWLRDICRSDHYPFWRRGWPALMITDTADFRSPHYHQPTDLPRHIDFDGLARVVIGLTHVVEELAGP